MPFEIIRNIQSNDEFLVDLYTRKNVRMEDSEGKALVYECCTFPRDGFVTCFRCSTKYPRYYDICGICMNATTQKGNAELLRARRLMTDGIILNVVQRSAGTSTEEAREIVRAAAESGRVIGEVKRPWCHNQSIKDKVKANQRKGFEGHRHRYYADLQYQAACDAVSILVDLYYNTYIGSAEEMTLVEPFDPNTERLPTGKGAGATAE